MRHLIEHEYIPAQALWINMGKPSKPAGTVTIPPPRSVGVCKVPPGGLLFKEYDPERDGPLVDLFYDTAAYVEGPVF